MAIGVLLYSAPKFRTSRWYMNSLKMNVFFFTFHWWWMKFCLWAYQTSRIYCCRQIFHIFYGWRVILVKPRKLEYHVQLKITCEPWHISKICLQDLILQIWKAFREIFSRLCLKISILSQFLFRRMCHEAVIFGAEYFT